MSVALGHSSWANKIEMNLKKFSAVLISFLVITIACIEAAPSGGAIIGSAVKGILFTLFVTIKRAPETDIGGKGYHRAPAFAAKYSINMKHEIDEARST